MAWRYKLEALLGGRYCVSHTSTSACGREQALEDPINLGSTDLKSLICVGTESSAEGTFDDVEARFGVRRASALCPECIESTIKLATFPVEQMPPCRSGTNTARRGCLLPVSVPPSTAPHFARRHPASERGQKLAFGWRHSRKLRSVLVQL